MTSHPYLQSTFTRFSSFVLATLLAVTATANGSSLPDDPFESSADPMAMVPVNHTDRYAGSIFVAKYWAGDVFPHGGGGKAACCFPGLDDWTQPVKVSWSWAQDDARDGKPAVDEIKRSIVTHFPAEGPRSSTDPLQNDNYVCVIFYDLDTVELAFSPSRRACTAKSRSNRDKP